MNNEDTENNGINFECPYGFDKEARHLLLQKIIDGQSTEEERQLFYQSIKKCEKCECKNICDNHQEIKNLLKEYLKEKNLPFGFIDQIKERIKAFG